MVTERQMYSTVYTLANMAEGPVSMGERKERVQWVGSAAQRLNEDYARRGVFFTNTMGAAGQIELTCEDEGVLANLPRVFMTMERGLVQPVAVN